jgi:hypothetical protein
VIADERADDVEVRAVLRVPGKPDKEVVVHMPSWAAPNKGGGK